MRSSALRSSSGASLRGGADGVLDEVGRGRDVVGGLGDGELDPVAVGDRAARGGQRERLGLLRGRRAGEAVAADDAEPGGARAGEDEEGQERGEEQPDAALDDRHQPPVGAARAPVPLVPAVPVAASTAVGPGWAVPVVPVVPVGAGRARAGRAVPVVPCVVPVVPLPRRSRSAPAALVVPAVVAVPVDAAPAAGAGVAVALGLPVPAEAVVPGAAAAVAPRSPSRTRPASPSRACGRATGRPPGRRAARRGPGSRAPRGRRCRGARRGRSPRRRPGSTRPDRAAASSDAALALEGRDVGPQLAVLPLAACRRPSPRG